MVSKSYKFRIYTADSKKVKPAKTFGCVIKVWNENVVVFNSYKEETNPKPVLKTSTQLRKEYPFMAEVSLAALQQKKRDFREFKNQMFNKNRKKKVGFPKFKKRNNYNKFRLINQQFYIKDNQIQLQKIGKVKIVLDRKIPENAKFVNVTVFMNKCNQYFASVLVEEEIKHLSKTNKTVGIDVGIKSFLVTSEGEIVRNLKYFHENQAKITRLQWIQSCKTGCKKGEKKSRRWLKNQKRINRIFQKITNQQFYFLHEISTKLVRDYDVIFCEDLNVEGMIKNHNLAKAIQDVSWSKFFEMLKYKNEWYSKEFVKVDRFLASTKTCNSCGENNETIMLKDRVFECSSCGYRENRDLNAAKNIKSFGVSKDSNRTQSALAKSNHDEISSVIKEKFFNCA